MTPTFITSCIHCPPTLRPLEHDFTHLHTLADHEAAAQQRLSAQAWAYFSGGAADEVTLRANQQQWATLTLAPRVSAVTLKCKYPVSADG
jgi:hypothetical protein